MKSKGIGTSFGTFGEILQGELTSGRRFLVTLPISRFTYCSYSSTSKNLSVYPQEKYKTKQFVKLLLKHLNLPVKGKLILESNIPVGKGLASSSADLVASARAISDFYGVNIPIHIIEDIMSQIEPSDGVIYDGIVSYFYIEVKLHKKLGNTPHMVILGIDEGGEVDTQQFNLKPKKFSDNERVRYEQLLLQLEVAISTNNLTLVGKIATESTLLNQKFLKKNFLKKVIEVNNNIGGLGVVTTHSGTYIGILLDGCREDINLKIEEGMKLLSLYRNVYIYKTYSSLDL